MLWGRVRRFRDVFRGVVVVKGEGRFVGVGGIFWVGFLYCFGYLFL